MIKNQRLSFTISALVEEAMSILAELGADCRDAYDNIPENLQNSERAGTLQRTAETLESLFDVDTPESVGDIVVEIVLPVETRVGRTTRRLRCEQATTRLSAVLAAAQKWCEEYEEVDTLEDVEQMISEIEIVIDAVSDVEFPGHRG